MSNAISNTDDTIDSRDVIERIEELEAERDSYNEESEKGYLESVEEIAAFDNSEEGQELTALKKLAEQGETVDDWEHGVQLIHEDYFETAMDDMVTECYELPKALPFWMTITYDYDALKQDCTEVDFDGQTYYVR